MNCKDCKSSDIKVRTNYSHGKKSKARVTAVCKKCGSFNVETDADKNKRGRFRR